ncbi:Blocked early in transport 1 like protein [Fasciolopsis buskii]|uniref:Blocked early in transport 1 like protein n=1 Tax=Fasciolopsis buskii TaxID=27845 RepID=A0A8E0RP86_9TREM|nr:Blocked early in transport 1 like protein [Fasciolopsis buski]
MTSNQLLLEQENNRLADNLSYKVSLLKSFAKDIEMESKEQNTFLDQMQNSMDTASGMLSNTLYQVMGIPKNLTRSRRFMCYFIASLTLLLVIAYFALFR